MTAEPRTSVRASSRKKTSGWVIAIVAGLVIIGVGIYLFTGKSDKNVGAGVVRAVPIVASKAVIGDLPVILTGLGTVTPTDVVTVKTRVNGHLLNVAFREGQMVKQGDLLAEIDPRPYEVQLMQAEGQRDRSKAALHNAQLDLDRYKGMIDQGVISTQELDTQTAQTDQLAAALKSDEGTVESAKLNLTYCRITAPVSGRVGIRNVDPGNIVNASDPNGIVVITSLAPIYVLFSIPADSINMVIAKNYQKMDAEAWDRDATTKLATGKLWAIDNQVDPATGTVKIKALYSNQDSSLFPNQFVNVRLHVDTISKAVLVPSASIQRGPQGTFVYVVTDESLVELRNVEVLASQGDLTALKSGIEVGETVVTEGIERLRPGAKVTIPGAEPPQEGGNPGTSQGQQRQGRSGS